MAIGHKPSVRMRAEVSFIAAISGLVSSLRAWLEMCIWTTMEIWAISCRGYYGYVCELDLNEASWPTWGFLTGISSKPEFDEISPGIFIDSLNWKAFQAKYVNHERPVNYFQFVNQFTFRDELHTALLQPLKVPRKSHRISLQQQLTATLHLCRCGWQAQQVAECPSSRATNAPIVGPQVSPQSWNHGGDQAGNPQFLDTRILGWWRSKTKDQIRSKYDQMQFEDPTMWRKMNMFENAIKCHLNIANFREFPTTSNNSMWKELERDETRTTTTSDLEFCWVSVPGRGSAAHRLRRGFPRFRSPAPWDSAPRGCPQRSEAYLEAVSLHSTT